MTDLDRTYIYVARTFAAPGLTVEKFSTRLTAAALPSWRELLRAGVLASVETLRKVGDIELHTSARPVRDWDYFVLLELAEGVATEELLESERRAGIDGALAALAHVEYLSCEVLTRPAGAGTAIPRPAPGLLHPPADQFAGIEYIYIPPPHWQEYQDYMRHVMGPVGARMTQLGHCYRVQIMERMTLLRWDESLPSWNRVHILWAAFDAPGDAFIRRTTEVIRAHLGEANDVESTLGRVAHYRLKPRMSKNVRVESLCLQATPLTDTGR